MIVRVSTKIHFFWEVQQNIKGITSCNLKILAKIKYANLLNIAANPMLIPELLQSWCNPREILNWFLVF